MFWTLFGLERERERKKMRKDEGYCVHIYTYIFSKPTIFHSNKILLHLVSTSTTYISANVLLKLDLLFYPIRFFFISFLYHQGDADILRHSLTFGDNPSQMANYWLEKPMKLWFCVEHCMDLITLLTFPFFPNLNERILSGPIFHSPK